MKKKQLVAILALVATASFIGGGIGGFTIGSNTSEKQIAALATKAAEYETAFRFSRLDTNRFATQNFNTATQDPGELFKSLQNTALEEFAEFSKLGNLGDINFPTSSSSFDFARYANLLNQTASTGQKQTIKNMDFCQAVNVYGGKFSSTFEKKQSIANLQYSNYQEGKTQQNWDADYEKIRQTRTIHTGELDNQSQLVEQFVAQQGTKPAEIKAFVTELKTLKKKYQGSLDSARQDYESNMQPMVQKVLAENKKATAELRTQVTAAVTKAKTDCAAGKSSSQVQKEFEATMRQIKSKAETYTNTLKTYQTQLETFRAKYQSGLDAAKADFQALLEKYQNSFGGKFIYSLPDQSSDTEFSWGSFDATSSDWFSKDK